MNERMTIKVLKAGMMTTIQDQGRTGHRDIGVPVSGVMDRVASRIANLLVGNKTGYPVLELTYGDLELRTETDVLIAYCGDGCRLIANDIEVAGWKTIFVPAATVLKFKSIETGCRTYIAVAGGWAGSEIMHSSSTYLPIRIGGQNGDVLHAGDIIGAGSKPGVVSLTMLSKLSGTMIRSFNWGIYADSLVSYSRRQIRVFPNREFGWFDAFSQQAFFSDTFTLNNQSDRMGYRLDGEPLTQQSSKQLLSAAVNMGTIQVTTSGTMILLMADCQTIGGYARIGQVAAADLPVCAQLKPGDAISFKRITIQEAESAFLQSENDIRDLEKMIVSKVISNHNAEHQTSTGHHKTVLKDMFKNENRK